MATVLATSRSFSSGSVDLIARLSDAGHSVVIGSPGHELAALRPALADAVGWIAGTGAVTSEHLDAAPNLRVIARYGVGFEAVDIAAAAEREIVVTNTPGANSSAVADHTVGLMLAVLRGTVEGARRVRSGDWSTIRGRELGSMTVGIVGFGRIGQGVAARLAGFGSEVLVHDPWMSESAIADLGTSVLDVAEMPSECDLVTLHAPGGTVIVDELWLSTARPGLVIVNTARPDLVDEAALADSLRRGVVAGYAADTLAGDVLGEHSPLLAADLADRVIVTPHLGAQTVESVDAMGSIAVDNLLAVLDGAAPPHPVGAPPAASSPAVQAPARPAGAPPSADAHPSAVQTATGG